MNDWLAASTLRRPDMTFAAVDWALKTNHLSISTITSFHLLLTNWMEIAVDVLTPIHLRSSSASVDSVLMRTATINDAQV